MSDIRVAWDRGDFAVARIGAMCGPAHFDLGGGKIVQPFAVAPWSENPEQDPRYDDLPPLLRRLRGEWACVPFGAPEPRTDLPPEWTTAAAAEIGLGRYFHGPSSNLTFDVEHEGPGEISLVLTYPREHPIASVRRSIRGIPGMAVLEFVLEVEPRETITLPIGIHPTFRLPEVPGTATLHVEGAHARVHTFPTDAEPGISQLAHGVVAQSLSSVPDIRGGHIDMTHYPLPAATEELVLVGPVNGHARLVNSLESYQVDLRWDPLAFPSVNLWASNRGRTAYPWNGRHLALGIEPVAAPWDLGVAAARNPNLPLRARGVRTSVQLEARRKWSTRYSVQLSVG